MAKIFTYTITIIGIIMLLKLGGIILPSTLLFNAFGLDGTYILGASLVVAITAALALYATSQGITATFLGRTVPESVVRAGIAGLLIAATIPDMVGIWWLAPDGWIRTLLGLIIMPLVAGYMIAIVQWFGGQDL